MDSLFQIIQNKYRKNRIQNAQNKYITIPKIQRICIVGNIAKPEISTIPNNYHSENRTIWLPNFGTIQNAVLIHQQNPTLFFLQLTLANKSCQTSHGYYTKQKMAITDGLCIQNIILWHIIIYVNLYITNL